MKDKKCKTEGCKGMINSNLNKSGLCDRCGIKKWQVDNPERFYKLTRDCYLRDKDKFDKIKHDHYQDNKENYKAKAKRSYDKDPKKRMEQIRLYHNKRYREDEGFRMRKKLGGALWKVVDYYIKTGKVMNPCKKYGIDWEGIIKQLSPIPKDRHKYHVDHIIQLSKFDLTNIEQIQIAFAPENHRWLLAKDNLRRNRKE